MVVASSLFYYFTGRSLPLSAANTACSMAVSAWLIWVDLRYTLAMSISTNGTHHPIRPTHSFDQILHPSESRFLIQWGRCCDI
mmetsp:Transcript_41622/g.74979  ORF Transcript_41622/g.74979 Transcript_41622/m.74979 type:complete len:83 (+) Transcript_41622:509-757(+)